MTGRLRDPMVGRDVLWGVTLGGVWGVVASVGFLILKRVGGAPTFPSQTLLTGGRQMLGVWLLQVVDCVMGTLQFFFLVFILRIVLRNKWLAAAAFVAVWTALNTLPNKHVEVIGPMFMVIYAIAAYAVTRFGLITLAVAIFTADLLLNLPFSLDFSNWYTTNVLMLLLSFVAIAGWGFYESLAGQKLLKEDLFE